MYAERPSRLGAGAILWTGLASGRAGGTRILPDGCMDLIWTTTGLLVAGPDTRAYVHSSRAGDRSTGLRFAPGQGPAILGLPASELRDTRVPLDAVWPAGEVRELTERIAEAPTPGGALETAVRARGGPDARSGRVYELVRAGRPVAEVAAAVNYSERQLHRHALAAFGYGPKTLARILRMRRALRLAREGQAFGEVAATAGYADQAHLAREVKALAGIPLGTLLDGG
ncbi:helix-turn-helix domain-containing protein [Streptomyces oceani]|uniref:AraC family transcriptional regulator n=1 Tax=Streptomyces oceani TaxID=1075402 RepID=A0A1E7KFL5_9ACTN|nr:helix-turn-helix domain-containing protein [Streptomyces oceani]OEV02674.1 AraC family transcriptional regulator [Streptomyces oceani]